MNKRGRPIAVLLVFAMGSATPLVARADAPPGPPVATAPPPSMPPAPPPPLSSTSLESPRFAAFLTAGLAVAGLGLGTLYGALAVHAKNSFDQNPTQSSGDFGNEAALISDTSFGFAVVMAVTSTALFLKKPAPPPAGSVSWTLTPAVTPHGGGAGAVLRF